MSFGRVDADRLAVLAEVVESLTRRGSDNDEVKLPELVNSARHAVRDADYAGISVRRRDGLMETLTATHAYPMLLDDIQRKCGEGPAVTATTPTVIRIDDLASDTRWPRFSRLARQRTTVISMLLLPLGAAPKYGGSLTLYSDRPQAFGDDAVDAARIYAAYAALAWRQLRRGEQFRAALTSRDLIGQAKGMIMERFSIDAEQAFELLKRLSQTMNLPLVDVAQRLTDRTADPSSIAPR